MSYLSPASALAAYRSGRADEALVIADELVRQDPFAAEAHICVALIHMRRNAVAETIGALKKAIASRSAEWVLGMMRADFANHGRPPLLQDMAINLGSLLRTALGPLGPILPPEARRSTHPYMNVVGTSYVRGFGCNPAFFPLFIGMGPSTLFLTEEAAAITRRKFVENMRRLDTIRDTLLILGSDAYYHAANFLKTRSTDSLTATDEDFACMDRVAVRHEGLLNDARKIISGRVLLMCSAPTHSSLMTQLAKRLNEGLRRVCERTGVTYLDWWDILADPQTQRLRSKYCVDATHGDVHFTVQTTALFIDLLKAQGVFNHCIPATTEFDWTHVFECEVNTNERMRIWCEPSITPNNAIKSHKIASSHLAQRTADLVVAIAPLTPEQAIVMVNVRDAFIATLVPATVQSGCVALTDTLSNQLAGQMALDFYGRSDILLRCFDGVPESALLSRAFGLLLLCIHPNTTADDEARCNATLRCIGDVVTVLIATPYPDRLANIDLGGRAIIATVRLADRHIPESWHKFVVVVAK